MSNPCQLDHQHRYIYPGMEGEQCLWQKDVNKRFVRTVPSTLDFSHVPEAPTPEAIEKAAVIFLGFNKGLQLKQGEKVFTSPINHADFHWMEVETFKKTLCEGNIVCLHPFPLPNLLPREHTERTRYCYSCEGKRLDKSDIGQLVVRLRTPPNGDRSVIPQTPTLSALLDSAILIHNVTEEGASVKTEMGNIFTYSPYMNDDKWIRIRDFFQKVKETDVHPLPEIDKSYLTECPIRF